MTMEPTDSFEHAGLAVRILRDDDQEYANPRTDGSNLGVMFCDYRGYTLGDKDAPDPRDQTTTCEVCDGEGYVPHDGDEGHTRYDDGTMICEGCAGNGEIDLSIIEYLKREHGARVILPLFVYEHSEITMSCGGRLDKGEDDFHRTGRFIPGDGWDTSSVGVIFDTTETRKECGIPDDPGEAFASTDENIEAQLRNEVAYYAAYLEGSVFGYEVVAPELDEDGEFDPDDCDGEVLDSCWGFLELSLWGREEPYVKVAAREAAECCAERIANERAEAHRWACADVVTVP